MSTTAVVSPDRSAPTTPRAPMMEVPLVDLKAQYAGIREEVEPAIASVLQNCDFVLGAPVARFERAFADYCGAGFAVGVDCGISALELTLRAWGIGPGDEVITAGNSFVASAAAISAAGATPVLVDVEPETLLMTAEGVERAITPRTRAIMPVHLYGQPVDMDPLMALAEARGLKVLEDACQAHGARCKGRRAGSLGHAAAFSFYPGKNLGAYGDGGIVTTSDQELADRIRRFRNYGQAEKYRHVSLPLNRRLDTLQAAVLEVKLPHLDDWNRRRSRAAAQYRALLQGLPVRPVTVRPGVESAYHLFVIQVDDRDEVLSLLQREGIGAGIHYPVPIHLQPVYSGLPYGPGSFPVAEAAASRLLSLPLFPELTGEQVEYVARTLRSIVG